MYDAIVYIEFDICNVISMYLFFCVDVFLLNFSVNLMVQ